MQTALYMLCALLWAAGLICFFLVGTSAVIQIIGCIIGLSGTVAFAGGAIVGALEDMTRQLKPVAKEAE